MKSYDKLTETQKEKIRVMYAIQETVREFLYDFDDKGIYHGRTPVPVEKKPEEEVERPRKRKRTKK